MNKNNDNKSPLLDEYIQKQNQNKRFDSIEEEDIANVIKTLLKTNSKLPKDLN